MNDIMRDAATSDAGLGDAMGETARVMGEFEYALTIAHLAFERWMLKCITAAGQTGLTATDNRVLHVVHHRARSTRLTDVAFVLNADDTHVIAYALRKLEKLGILTAVRRGKEKFYSTTPEGSALVDRYRANQRAFLLRALNHFPGSLAELEQMAETLRAMSGFYDQAARRAATII